MKTEIYWRKNHRHGKRKKFTYMMITGDNRLTPKTNLLKEEMRIATNKENANGDLIKVIIVSSGSEDSISKT